MLRLQCKLDQTAPFCADSLNENTKEPKVTTCHNGYMCKWYKQIGLHWLLTYYTGYLLTYLVS